MPQTGLYSPDLTLAKLQRARFVSENYHGLRGGVWVLLGLIPIVAWPKYSEACFQLAMSSDTLLYTVIGYAAAIMQLVVVAAVSALAWVMNRYYDRHYGVVDPLQKRLLSPLVWPLLIAQCHGILASINYGLLWQIDLLALAFGWCLAKRPGAWRESPHYGILATLWMVASLAPLWIVPQWIGHFKVWQAKDEFDALEALFRNSMGLSIILLGLLDHRLLTRYLPPPPQEQEEAA